MRLEINIPRAWPPDVSLRIDALALLPDDQRAWVQQALSADAPGTRLVIVSDETTRTLTGWPLRIVAARLESADGTIREHRLGAFYAFFEHAATVLACAVDGARLAALTPALRDALVAASPVWTDGVVALAELWDLVVPPPR
jgi:hypothetical protein